MGTASEIKGPWGRFLASYLMSRGLSEDEATSTIVRGFLNVDIPGLPPQLKAEIDKAIEESDKEVM